MAQHLFCYGTLEFPEVMTQVAGRPLSGERAVVEDYERRRMRGGPWPGIVAVPGGLVHGTLYAPVDSASLRRLDRYEGDQYRRVVLDARTGSRIVPAWTYVTHAGLVDDADWDRDEFACGHLQEYLDEVRRELSSLPFGNRR
ncbi:MAG: gamma-glutamylcyclotransferase family protein [Gammaproteobacteria bacterium]|jgi:gamma-glutamylcyclotransferase (GGCT)/AIG2-like uncharacterized protein YtfP|nr:gamma-glutamylcyclotransferase family protein [Gammaproteobacteria bacterium]